MLRRAASHGAHVLMEALVGLAAVVALAGCVFAWRLAQGPIDVTPLLRRFPSLVAVDGARVTIGKVSLAWEGFGSADQPLDIRVGDVEMRADDPALSLHLAQARVALSVRQLLLGRAVPRSVMIDGMTIRLVRPARAGAGPAALSPAVADPAGMLLGLMAPDRRIVLPPVLAQLHHLRVTNADIAVHDQRLGADWQAPNTRLDMILLPDGRLAGSAQLDLAAGDARTTLVADAALRPDGSDLTITTTPVSPAALARTMPAFAGLAAADLPIGVRLQATMGRGLAPQQVRLDVVAGSGTVQAGQGAAAVQAATATISLRPAELRLDAARIAFAPAAGSRAPPPVLTGSANATWAAGRIHALFGVQIDGVALADLGKYWPAGTGGGARPWLVQNITAGHAHDAHVSGAIDSGADLSDLRVTALSGGLVADDVTVFWLRPIPGLVHGRARVTIQGPDALLVTMDSAEQAGLRLAPGSSIRIIDLEERHQFGDIDIGLSGPLLDVLAVLNHPRLNLLSRSNIEMVDPSGMVTARLKLHVPLEDRVSMDQIPISADVTVADAHLGRVAGGYDLDQADLALKVDGNGLSMTGHGDVGGIGAALGLTMDFRNGPPDQVLQHATAEGVATPAQLAAAGLPAAAAQMISGGVAALRVVYDGRRDDTATLRLDADLARAGMTTPLGWSKPPGPPASAGAVVLLDHGRLAGVEQLHAEGPDLAIVSRAEVRSGRAETLLLDRLEIGQTSAHGRIGFPGPGRPGYGLQLTGRLLDLSGYLARPAARAGGAPPPKPADDDQTGPPWTIDMRFDRLELAKAEVLTPFVLQAASNGRHILHASLDAGLPGQLAAAITPVPAGRRVKIQAQDAGLVLKALGVADNLRGGRLDLDARYDDGESGEPLGGTATLTEFNLLAAPAIGRLLQAMTLYGLADVLRGPGLHFSRLVAPFRWQSRILHLTNARAFSPSLGLTAAGDLDVGRRTANITGTVVPAYFFNQLLGDLPLVGRIFSPEKGGGVFAARYSVRGPLSDPKVGVNPLSALTPGFLREGFGLLNNSPPAH